MEKKNKIGQYRGIACKAILYDANIANGHWFKSLAAVPLSIQLPANVPEKSAEDGRSAGAPATKRETRRASGFKLVQI